MSALGKCRAALDGQSLGVGRLAGTVILSVVWFLAFVAGVLGLGAGS